MSDLCQERCPHCEADPYFKKFEPKVYPVRQGPNEGLSRCERHGCVLVEGEWVFECRKCEKRTDKLYGLFVPFLCKECFDKAVAHQIATGNVCSMCRQPRMLCCC